MTNANPLNHNPRPIRDDSSGRPAPETAIDYWRVERVARCLDVSKKRIYQLVQERRLTAIRLGPRQMRITRDSLDAYLARLRRQAEDGWTE